MLRAGKAVRHCPPAVPQLSKTGKSVRNAAPLCREISVVAQMWGPCFVIYTLQLHYPQMTHRLKRSEGKFRPYTAADKSLQAAKNVTRGPGTAARDLRNSSASRVLSKGAGSRFEMRVQCRVVLQDSTARCMDGSPHGRA